jgi:predicted DNA-binding transcriptional regulator YafY
MYSPTTRLLTVLALLQSHRQITGKEIAERLEIDTRTVRRYITMLQDMGVPVEGERGPHGAYHLGRGSKMPPLMFTDAEAVALTLGLLALREFRLPADTTAIEGALAKTERVLPETLLEQVRSLQKSITFDISPMPASPQSDMVTTLSMAINQRQRVHLRYRAFDEQESERDFDPYGIVFHDTYWYTAGYCHLRQSLRTFRLDRILSLDLLKETFTLPQDFDPLAHVRHSLATTPGSHTMRILLKASLKEVEHVVPSWVGVLEETAEGVILTPAAPHQDWVAYLLLDVDFPVVILESDVLRARMRQITERAAQIAEA